jgi:hypothetical protein
MQSLIRRPFFALALPAALLSAGCDHDGGPSDPPPLPAIDSTTVLAFAGTSSNQMQGIIHGVFSGQDLATPNPFLLPDLGAAPAAPVFSAVRAIAACAPVQTGVDSDGVAIDTDLDGVPDDNTVDFGSGCSILDGGLEYTFSGKYRLRDQEVGLKDWEYVTTALAARVRDTLTGDFFRKEVSGTESAHFSPGHAAHQMDVVLKVASRSGADSGHVTLRTLTASTYDPTSGSSFVLGGTLPQGTFGFAAELTFRDIVAGGDSLRFVIATPTPIHTSFGCASGIDAGQLRGLFEGDTRVGFRYTWPGCGAPLFEEFGTTP